MGHIVIDADICKGCALCAVACSYQLIKVAEHFNQKGYHPAKIDEARQRKCTGCALCAWMCPDVAITVYR